MEKINTRVVRRKLKKYFKFLKQYIDGGVERERASKQAYEDVLKLKIGGK